MGNGIWFEAAECTSDCRVHCCAKVHANIWYVFDIPYFSHAAAEAALIEARSHSKNENDGESGNSD